MIILICLINLPNVFAQGSLKMDLILEHDFNNYYNFPQDTNLYFEGNNDICPINKCVMMYDEGDFMAPTFRVEDNNMTLNGAFRLEGSRDAGIMDFVFTCEPNEIQENPGIGTTKYTCNGGSGSFIPERKALCNYDFSASFDLPSRHFVFNGTNTGTRE